MANCLEALIAAVYLDSGLDEVKNFILRLFENRIKNVVEANLFYDYKSVLNEKCLKLYKTKPLYICIEEKGPDHKKSFCVELFVNNKSVNKAWGNSKKKAEQNAARLCLESDYFKKQ